MACRRVFAFLPKDGKNKTSAHKIIAFRIGDAKLAGAGKDATRFICRSSNSLGAGSSAMPGPNIRAGGWLMKISNWCRKLSAAIVAGGILVPSAAKAADLNINLVTNGNFENVDLAVTGNYNGPRILGWTGPNLFAYSHNGSMSSKGVVPDYAEGADPPNAGNWYFSSNNTGVADPTDVRAPDVYFQDINVSTGGTGSAIAAGLARYNLNAFMSSYLNDNDNANVRVDFRNTAGGSIGNATLSDPDFGPDNVWSPSSLAGTIPVGTTSVRMSLFGTPRNSGADGYIDNVAFSVSRIPEPTTGVLAGLVFTAAGMAGIRRRRDE
jgi:hypothetical protein